VPDASVAPKPLPRKRPTGAPARRRVLTDLRKGEIIAAALKVFARKGFHETCVEDVAVQAKIAKGTLYLYFKSKETIYEAALDHAMEQLEAAVNEQMQTAQSAEDKVRAFVSARLHFWGAHGDLYRMILTVGREKKHRRHTNGLLSQSVDGLVVHLREVAPNVEDANVVRAVGWAVMDMVRGALERRIDLEAAVSIEVETSLITGMAVRQLQAQTAPLGAVVLH
jgi:AcrR family transcriptional regulator